MFRVALHPEGVDRNINFAQTVGEGNVALHPEGVDRNFYEIQDTSSTKASPSTRRAWIEMLFMKSRSLDALRVALHPEGVYRN